MSIFWNKMENFTIFRCSWCCFFVYFCRFCWNFFSSSLWFFPIFDNHHQFAPNRNPAQLQSSRFSSLFASAIVQLQFEQPSFSGVCTLTYSFQCDSTYSSLFVVANVKTSRFLKKHGMAKQQPILADRMYACIIMKSQRRAFQLYNLSIFRAETNYRYKELKMCKLHENSTRDEARAT